ncbi:MAG: hypothetical protein PHD07_01440 [Bacteroidales bacterium]|nr:hypothetical protein [Bacteroidales bacterium]MDD3201739.1 hypothetical protein [Bacteroidales bacterium]
MEELRMNELGLKELNSSELQTTGGISFVDALRAIEKIRLVVTFISNYIPELVEGFKDGYAASQVTIH